MTTPDITFEQTWHWTCYSCWAIDDPGVPGAYGIGDTLEEVQLEASLHARQVHPWLKAVS